MKALIHIGTEKTGTSSIQKFLMLNRKNLVSQGFHFMKSSGNLDDRKLSAYCLMHKKFDDFHRNNLIDSLDKKKSFESNLEKEMDQELKSLSPSIDTVIFSSEHFHSRVKLFCERQKLKTLLIRFFDEIELITYLRPQIEMAVSRYSTELKSNAFCNLEDSLERCRPDNYYYNYAEYLGGWVRTFSKKNLHVKLFDRALMKNGDVVNDFCDAVGLNFESLVPGPVVNKSVRPTGQEMLRVLNTNLPTFIRGVGKNPARLYLVRWINKFYSGQGIQPNVERVKSIQSKFETINENVRSTWFPDRTSLFEIDFSKYKKPIEPNWEKVHFFEKFILQNLEAFDSVENVKRLMDSDVFKMFYPDPKNTTATLQRDRALNLNRQRKVKTKYFFRTLHRFLKK